MKKLTKIMSVMLALVMVLSAMPILASAEDINVTSSVIDFAGETDSTAEEGQIYGDYLYFEWASNSYRFKDEQLYIPWFNANNTAIARTTSFWIKGASLQGTEKYGVYTYKFKYKYDGTLVLSSDNDTTYGSYNVAAVLDSTSVYLRDGGTTLATKTWTELGANPVSDYCAVELIFDLYNKRVGMKINDNDTIWGLSSGLTTANAKYLYFRSGMASGKDLYMDDISVSYTNTVPVIESTLSYDFTDGTVPATLAGYWDSSSPLSVVDDPATASGKGKVLQVAHASNQDGATGVKFTTNFVDQGKGTVTYEFDVKLTKSDAVLHMYLGKVDDDTARPGALAPASMTLLNPVQANAGTANTADWNKVKIVANLDNNTVAVYLNDMTTPLRDPVSTTTSMQTNEMFMALKASKQPMYVDNLKATYAIPAPTFALTAGRPSIQGVTDLAGFASAESLTVSMPVENTYPEAETVDVTYIVGLYNGTTLVGCMPVTASGSAAAKVTTDITATISDVSFKAGKTYDSVKMFAWNSLTGLAPLTGVGSIDE